MKAKKSLSNEETCFFLRQILEGVQYLHGKNVIHRDLKLGNLFLGDKLEIKIGDFGLATNVDFDGQRKKTLCGTPNYIAPEVLENNGHSYEVDVWSIGVIMYTLLVGTPPFETNNVKATYKKIKEIDFTFPNTISSEARDLIEKILVLDPKRRPTISEVLNHPFMKAYHQATLPSSLVRFAKSTTTDMGPPTLPIYHPEKQVMNEIRSPLKVLQTENIRTEPKDEKVFSLKRTTPDSPLQVASPKKVKMVPQDEVSMMHKNLHNSLNGHRLESTPLVRDPEVWVRSYADFTNKYGLAYRLTNGIMGTFFNDCTKLMWNANTDQAEYIERSKVEREKFNLSNHTEDLKKKATLMRYFDQYLTKGKTDASPKVRGRFEDHSSTPLLSNQDYVYVRRFLRTKHAVLFRLSNHTVQVSFFDGFEIILTCDAQIVTSIDLFGEKKTSTLDEIKGNEEISKRLKYTKELLGQLINK
jgi:polo-like kinase 1